MVFYSLKCGPWDLAWAGTQMVFGNRVTDSRSFFRAIDKDNSDWARKEDGLNQPQASPG